MGNTSIAATKKVNLGGRPPKFSEARRAITITLPDRTLEQLAHIDNDRAKAIVKATDALAPKNDQDDSLVQVVEVAHGLGVILVAACKALKKIPFLRTVEITPARFLLTITPGTSIDSLEIAISDLLDELPHNEEREHNILNKLKDHFTRLRRTQKIAKMEMLLVSTQ